jgi:hypothetical protein
MDFERTDIDMVDDEAAPPNGAIPVIRRGGPRDGGLMGYASVAPNLDGTSTTVFMHGAEPHPEPVEGCEACASFWEVP